MIADIINFLRYIGDDWCEDESVELSPECKGQKDKAGYCPKHNDCGICRFEYMKERGWLAQKHSTNT